MQHCVILRNRDFPKNKILGAGWVERSLHRTFLTTKDTKGAQRGHKA